MATMVFTALAVLVAANPPESHQNDGIPRVLKDAFLQRESFDSARFRCRLERSEPGRALVVENWLLQFAKNGVHAVELGDDDGVILKVPTSGQPILGWAGAAQPADRVLDFKTGENWLHRTGSRQFVVGAAGLWMGYLDLRTLGLRSTEVQYKTPAQHLALLRPLIDWKTREKSPGLVTVTARGKDHEKGTHYEYEWIIDASMGPAVVSSRQRLLDRTGKCEYESEAKIDLALTDGVWWPMRVELNSSSGKRILVEFENHEFNRANHPKSISPAMLKIPIGAEVRKSGEKGRFFYIGGRNVVDEKTWLSSKEKYDLAPLKAFHVDVKAIGIGRFPSWWNARETEFGIQGVSSQPDLWEAYVRRWVIVRSVEGDKKGVGPVTDEQRTAAQGILDDCRKQATPIRSRIDKESARLAAELADVNNRLAKADEKSRAELTKRVGELMVESGKAKQAPEIERIFESLKKRLDGLLTKEQLAPYAPVKPTPPPPGPVPMTPPSR